MADKKFKYQTAQDLSQLGCGDSNNDIQEIKRDLEGWREVLIPLASLLRWDLPYFPGVIVGITTFLFSIVWYTDLSALTTISLACMLIGIVDFLVPFFGPNITGYHNWTGEEEMQFTAICERIAGVQQDITDLWGGLAAMRRNNAKLFFMVVMGMLSMTAWIGNLINNLFLTYIIVNFFLLLPGIRHHQIGQKHLQPVINMINQLKSKAEKLKTS